METKRASSSPGYQH